MLLLLAVAFRVLYNGHARVKVGDELKVGDETQLIPDIYVGDETPLIPDLYM